MGPLIAVWFSQPRLLPQHIRPASARSAVRVGLAASYKARHDLGKARNQLRIKRRWSSVTWVRSVWLLHIVQPGATGGPWGVPATHERDMALTPPAPQRGQATRRWPPWTQPVAACCAWRCARRCPRGPPAACPTPGG